MKERNE